MILLPPPPDNKKQEHTAIIKKNDGAFVFGTSVFSAFDFALQLENGAKEAYSENPPFNSYIAPKHKGLFVTIKEARAINIALLRIFDTFCREHSIHYSLTGGTLLGAIRHGGFIPWDDDVDVFMTRPEYEKLLNTFQDTDRYTLMNRQKDKTYNYVFSRLIDTRTFISQAKGTASAGYGLFLDICVVDGLPKNAVLRNLHIKYMKILRVFRGTTINSPKIRKKGSFKHLKLFFKKISAKFTTTDFWNKRIERAMKRYPWDASDFVGNFTSQYGTKEILHRSCFDSYIDVSFEDGLFMVCAGYQEYLSNIYGDYLSLPPKNKRKGHHQGIIFWI